MSFSYALRFDESDRTPAQMAQVLGPVLGEFDLQFGQSVTRLQSYGGRPGVDMKHLTREAPSTLDEVPALVKDWWGFGMLTVSQRLAARLGRGDWIEIDIECFGASKGKSSMIVLEARRAHDLRTKDDDAAGDVYALQMRLCQALGFSISIYDEEGQKKPPMADLDEVRRRVERAAQGVMGCSIIVSQALLDLEAARALAGPLAARVRQSFEYVLFPFLAK
jgi:hypothetical protein